MGAEEEFYFKIGKNRPLPLVAEVSNIRQVTKEDTTLPLLRIVGLATFRERYCYVLYFLIPLLSWVSLDCAGLPNADTRQPEVSYYVLYAICPGIDVTLTDMLVASTLVGLEQATAEIIQGELSRLSETSSLSLSTENHACLSLRCPFVMLTQ